MIPGPIVRAAVHGSRSLCDALGYLHQDTRAARAFSLVWTWSAPRFGGAAAAQRDEAVKAYQRAGGRNPARFLQVRADRMLAIWARARGGAS